MNNLKKIFVAAGVCFLLVLFCVVLYAPFCRTVLADDTFVTEEEGRFGGGNVEESKPKEEQPHSQSNSQPQPQLQPGQQSQPPAQSEVRQQVKPQQQPQPQQESDSMSVSEEMMLQETPAISQNSIAPVFRIPVRRPDIQSYKRKVEEQAREEVLPKEPENIEELPPQETEMHIDEASGQEKPEEERKLWFLFVGGLFLLCGCARICIRYGKLHRHML